MLLRAKKVDKGAAPLLTEGHCNSNSGLCYRTATRSGRELTYHDPTPLPFANRPGVVSTTTQMPPKSRWTGEKATV